MTHLSQLRRLAQEFANWVCLPQYIVKLWTGDHVCLGQEFAKGREVVEVIRPTVSQPTWGRQHGST